MREPLATSTSSRYSCAALAAAAAPGTPVRSTTTVLFQNVAGVADVLGDGVLEGVGDENHVLYGANVTLLYSAAPLT